MAGFINEQGLEAFVDLKLAFRLYHLIRTELLSKLTDFELYRDADFFRSEGFIVRFNKTSLPKDESALSRRIAFSEDYYKSWRINRHSHLADRYRHLNKSDFQNCSVSEAAIRKQNEPTLDVLLVSAKESSLDRYPLVELERHGSSATVSLENIRSEEDVSAFLGKLRGQYSSSSTSAPHDFQTILGKNPRRFISVGKRERRFKRMVFKEAETNRFFYVDEGHPGPSAHLEVYSGRHLHLGTADINSAELDHTKQVSGRKLRF